MSEKLTFAQRVERMLAAAKDLRDALELLSPAIEVVIEEAQAMQAAQERFASDKEKRGAIKR
jgi:SpoU rRNA methylase family enzyme